MPRSFEERQTRLNQETVDLLSRQRLQIENLQIEVRVLTLALSQIVGALAVERENASDWLSGSKNAIGKSLRKKGASVLSRGMAELTDQFFDRIVDSVQFAKRRQVNRKLN